MSLKIDMYISVADPAVPPPPHPFPLLIFRPNWGPKRISKGLDDRPHPPPPYLRVWMTGGPPYLKVCIRRCIASNLSPLWNITLPLPLGFAQTSLFFLLISYSDRLSACRLRWREIWERDCFPIIFFVFIYILLISFFLLWIFALSLLLLGPQF